MVRCDWSSDVCSSDLVETLVVAVNDMLYATIGDTAFVSQFHTIVGRLDTTLVVANRLLKRNEPVLNAALSDLRAVSSDLKELIKRNEAGLDDVVAGGNRLMTAGMDLVAQAESLVVDIQSILRKVESGQGTLGKLYTDDKLYGELKAVMGNVDTLVTEIKEDALRLRIRLGFGKKKN
jgi:phospholipid/cholesterol/gamma-HCH transport system substrate-binding protein